MKRVLSLGVVLLLGGALFFLIASSILSPAGNQTLHRVVHIPEGASFQQVASILESNRLIANRWAFMVLGKVMNVERRVIPGEYELHAGMTPLEILSQLERGKVLLHAVTIPEGYTVAQIAELFEIKGLAPASELKRLAQDRPFIRTLGLDVPSLEGYLYPDTYLFARPTPSRQVLRTLVSALQEVLTPELRTRATALGMTIHEVLTLASIIEKETGRSNERTLVSAVFHNRLRHDPPLPLQSDPTVIYALHAFDGDLKKRDLRIDSPYNTYRTIGLPPGPIANPGAEAIEAAVHPEDTNYLYFVSKNDGTHVFSETLAEHRRAVDRYQRQQAS